MTRISIFVSGWEPTADQNGLVAIETQWRSMNSLVDTAQELFADDIVSKCLPYDESDLTGHSFGGAACVKAAIALAALGKKVRTLNLLDPVHEEFDGLVNWMDWPPDWFMPFNIPGSVENTLCLRKAWGLPPSCETNVSGANQIIPGTSDHASFPRDPRVVAAVLKALSS